MMKRMQLGATIRRASRSTLASLAAGLCLSTLAPAPARALDGDRLNMTLLERFFRGIPRRVAIVDPYAYVALDTGLEVFDLTSPTGPVRVGHVYLPGPAYDVEVVGTRAFVAAGEAGLVVVNVANVMNPVVAASLVLPDARAVTVSGSYAYVAEAAGGSPPVFGLQVVEIQGAVPNLVPRGFAALPNGAIEVAVSGTTAYVGTGSDLSRADHGVHTVDVTVPTAPALLGAYSVGKAVNEIVIQGGVVYVAAGFPATGSLVVLDMSLNRLGGVVLAEGAMGVAVSAGTAYVAARNLGLVTYDVRNPAAIVRLGGRTTLRESVAVATRGSLVYLGERASIARAGFTALDALSPALPVEVASVPYAEAMWAAATSGSTAPDRAYLLRRDGLHIFDASNPGALGSERVYATSGADWSAVDVEDLLAAVAEGPRVRLLDVTDPANALPLGTLTVRAGVVVRPVLAGNLLYVVTSVGLEQWSIASRTAPSFVTDFVPVTGRPAGFALDVVAGQGFLVAGNTLQELNVPAMTAGRTLSVVGEQLYGVAVSEDPVVKLGVMTGLNNKLYVFHTGTVQLEGMLAPGGSGYDVRVWGDHAVVAAGRAGVISVNLANRTNPQIDGSYDTSGFAASVANIGKILYLATVEAQHWVMRCENCPDQACQPAWPAIAQKSLRGTRPPPKGNTAVYEWSFVSPSSGTSNFHRTTDKRALPLLYQNMTTSIGSSATTSYTDATAAVLRQPFYYRVFGQNSCTLDSEWP